MTDKIFTFDEPDHEYELTPDERILYPFKRIEKPSVWAVNKMRFGFGYGETGSFSFDGREWQREILDAYAEYKTVIICGPVQVGKSVCGNDIPWLWWNENVGGRSLIAYADKETAEDTFQEKLKDNIKNVIPHLWSGNDDDLKQGKISLLNGIARCASANVENDFATFPADFVVLDEVAKYDTNFDVIGASKGRQKSYKGMPGLHGILSIVSSPKKHGDPLYNAIHEGGVLILRPRMPCPHCGKFHELTDENIKEIGTVKGVDEHGQQIVELDHNPTRIRLMQEAAAKYECPNCHLEIPNSSRWVMLKKVVWLAEGEDIEEGRITNPHPLRGKTDSVCFWFNRLVSMPDRWSWADCLSAFFAARQAANPKAWDIYLNEDMARFTNPNTERISHSYLYSKRDEYLQYTEEARVPDGVIIMTAGIDTQDDGFYFVIRGWGKNMESWLVRQDFIHCDIKDSKFHDPVEVFLRLKQGIFNPVYVRNGGEQCTFSLGLIDEGGHRQRDVHFISRQLPIFRPYKGSSQPNAEPIKRSKNNIHYLGNTRHWSELVQRFMESDTWHLPKDISREYLEQVVKQYWLEEKDRHGNTKFKWISGGNDHYRDCENLAIAAAYIIGLPETLNDEARVEKLVARVQKQTDGVLATINKEVGQQSEQKPKPERKIPEDPFAYRDRRRY